MEEILKRRIVEVLSKYSTYNSNGHQKEPEELANEILYKNEKSE